MKIVTGTRSSSLVKVNPLATWSDDDVAYYLTSHDLPEHPLWAQGYASIGCAADDREATRPGRPSIGSLGRLPTRKSAASTRPDIHQKPLERIGNFDCNVKVASLVGSVGCC